MRKNPIFLSQAFQATGEEKYRKALDDIIEYVMRDMRHPSGGFYSAEDADSLPAEDGAEAKKEGAFCVWTHEEIRGLLGDIQIEVSQFPALLLRENKLNLVTTYLG